MISNQWYVVTDSSQVKDRRVVVTQQPKLSVLKIGEQLTQGDRPIVEYRR